MSLIWVRHGETDENRQRRYLGHYDATLNTFGREQIEELVKNLHKVEIDEIYTSDLARTYETATIIGDAIGFVPIKEKALRELDFGDWDRKTYEELMKEDRERAEAWYNDPFTESPPNGESLLELGKRVDNWLIPKITSQKEKVILIVSHGGPIRWFESKWINRDETLFWKVGGLKHGQAMIVESTLDKVSLVV